MIYLPEDHVVAVLMASPAVARLVGFNIFPIAVPEVGMPFIAYKRTNIRREGTITNVPLLMPEAGLQISSWAMKYEAAKELADAVRLSLDCHTGTHSGITIHDMRLVSEVDDYLDPTTYGAQLPPAYEVRQLYQVRWTEASR